MYVMKTQDASRYMSSMKLKKERTNYLHKMSAEEIDCRCQTHQTTKETNLRKRLERQIFSINKKLDQQKRSPKRTEHSPLRAYGSVSWLLIQKTVKTKSFNFSLLSKMC